jgi:hypothetical protein
LGALVTGASTVPEQVSASSLGVKCIGLGAISNPATGTVDGWTHDPEFYILAGKKSLAGLKLIIWRALETYPFNADYRPSLNLALNSAHSLKLQPITTSFDQLEEIKENIISRVSAFIHPEGHRISKLVWFMSDQIYNDYLNSGLNIQESTFVINLNSCGQMRSRSFEEGQILIHQNKDGENWISIRHPYLEGLFPQEYYVIIAALKALGAPDL